MTKRPFDDESGNSLSNKKPYSSSSNITENYDYRVGTLKRKSTPEELEEGEEDYNKPKRLKNVSSSSISVDRSNVVQDQSEKITVRDREEKYCGKYYAELTNLIDQTEASNQNLEELKKEFAKTISYAKETFNDESFPYFLNNFFYRALHPFKSAEGESITEADKITWKKRFFLATKVFLPLCFDPEKG